jgi:F0F1-type ATP synthase epsilon subunit
VNNVVSLLTNRAIAVEKLDAATIRQQLEAAENQPVGTRAARPARDQAIAQARAQLRIVQKA